MTTECKNIKYEVRLWWLFCFCATGCFGFKNWIPVLNQLYSTDSLYIIIFAFSLLLLLYYFINNRCIVLKSKMSKIHLYFFLVILIGFFISLRDYIPLGQTIIQTCKEFFYFFTALLLCFAFMQRKSHNLKIMNDVFIKASIVCGIVALIEFISYQLIGLDILKLGTAYDINMRNGSIRFGVGGFIVNFSAIFSFTRIFNKKGRLVDGVNLTFFFLQLVIFGKTRMMELAYIVLIIIMLLFTKKIHYSFRFLGIFCFILIGLFALTKVDSINLKISSYFEADAGIMIRFKTIEYYWNQILEKPFFGYGFITAHRESPTYVIMSGDGGYYFRDDVGIVGFLNQFGFLGGIWFFALLYSMFKYGFKYKNNLYAKELIWIGMLFILTMPTLIFVSYGSIISILIPTIIIDSISQKKKIPILNTQKYKMNLNVKRI